MEAPANSSISSSKPRIAGRALLFAVLFLAAYDLLVRLHRLPPGDGITDAQSNAIRIQRYLYDRDLEVNYVLTGSSLSANTKVENLDPGFYNLGILNGSTLTGLELVARASHKPRLVFLEMNEMLERDLERDADWETLRQMTAPTARTLATRLPWTQLEYQPVNVLLSAYKRRKERKAAGKEAVSAALSAARDSAIQAVVAEHAPPLDTAQIEKLRAHFDFIKAKIAAFRAQGIESVLVLIPMEPAVEQTPRVVQFKRLVREAFPESVFRWFPDLENVETWRTNDGYHVLPDQSKLIAQRLVTYAHDFERTPR